MSGSLSMTNEEKRYFALHYICTFFGVPYDFGGESSIGIDCSGLAQEFLRSVGMDPEG
jgi:cell wall-associated NlpC family hydrolase